MQAGNSLKIRSFDTCVTWHLLDDVLDGHGLLVEMADEFVVLVGRISLIDHLHSLGIGLGHLKSLSGTSGPGGLFVSGDDFLAILAADEAGVSLDVDEEGEDPGRDDGAAHDVKGLLGLQLAEPETESHRSEVAACADDPGDGSGDGRVDVGNDAVGGSLGGLDDAGEDDHDEDGGREGVGVGEDEDQNSLGDEEAGLPDETTAHAHLGVELVGHESADAAGEEVHPAEDGGDGGGALGGELELGLEVGRGGVVHGELDAEAAGVLDEEDPGVDVGGAAAEGGGGGDLGHGAVHLHVLVVTLGSVVRNPDDEESEAEPDGGGDEADGPPGLLRRHAELEEREEDGSHDDLGDASSEVAPATHERVGGTGDLFGEHAGGPELAADESGPAESDEEAKAGERRGAVDEAGAGAGNGARHQENSHQNTSAVLVAHGTVDESHEHGAGDGADVGRPDLLLRDLQRVLDLGEEGRDGEPDEEGREESHPRAVEGAHVRALEGEELDFGGLVILVGVDVDVVRVVLFDLG
mmetsp:Transcript_49771/g.105830  ORF Transcript_49771/g.105830 Transcript_49771/m.105830 type:complete len:524 (+) Transcript_49771:444-2015(+)